MFDKLIKAVAEISKNPVAFPVQVNMDADGELDRQCHAPHCQFEFKVISSDWRSKVKDEKAFCPFCGHSAPGSEWSTAAQTEYFTQVGVSHLSRLVTKAMREDAHDWNIRQPRNKLVSISLKVGEERSQKLPLPIEATEPMRLKICCPSCSCRYSVIGSAYFCPACGHNAAELVFEQSVAKIRTALQSLPTIRASINDRDMRENTSRLLVEGALQHISTAFQRYAEALFTKHPSIQQPRRNAFQNLEEGSSLWLQTYGKAYSDHLSATQMTQLIICFQQRHLLAHREGIVDEDYITRSNDHTYKAGQRLVIKECTLLASLDAVEELAEKLRQDTAQIP